MLSVPVVVVANTAARAFYAEVAELWSRQPDDVRLLFDSVVTRLGLISLFPAIVLLVGAQPIFGLLFGNEWLQAGAFSSALSICILFQFIQAPAAYVFYITGSNQKLLLLNIQRALIVATAFIASAYFSLNSLQTIWVYSILLSAHYALSTVYARSLIWSRT